MGRWHVDYGILHFSHKQKHNIVDLTLLISAHQGSESARRYKFEVADDDFFWNYQFYNSTDISSGLLTSNYLVVCYCLFIIHLLWIVVYCDII